MPFHQFIHTLCASAARERTTPSSALAHRVSLGCIKPRSGAIEKAVGRRSGRIVPSLKAPLREKSLTRGRRAVQRAAKVQTLRRVRSRNLLPCGVTKRTSQPLALHTIWMRSYFIITDDSYQQGDGVACSSRLTMKESPTNEGSWSASAGSFLSCPILSLKNIKNVPCLPCSTCGMLKR